ncbi:MAG: metal-dependent hydrolase family protein, partial [Sphingomicrobium sp.]
VDGVRRGVRRNIKYGVDVIKYCGTGGVFSKGDTPGGQQYTAEEAKALVDEAHMHGRRVAVHAHGADGINLALRNGADSIEHGTVMDDEIVRAMKKQGTYYVPTLSTVNGYLERLAANPNAYAPDVKKQIDWRIGITGQSLAKAYPAGVKIAFGTDAGVSKHGRNADEFELMVKWGMPPAEAIKAATVNAADLLGLSSEIGTIEPGKSADIIAVTGDPLSDVTVLKKVDFVMARGEVITAAR